MLASFIRLVTHTPDLQSYTVYKLYTSLRNDVSQEGLTLAGVWMIGEYGDVLLQGGTTAGPGEDAGGEEDGAGGATTSEAVSEKDVLDLLERILVSPYTNTTIRQFVLTALAKLSTRFAQHESQQRIAKAMHGFDASVELELQQRAIEFGTLLQLESIRGGVLERMPPPELKPTVMGTGARALPPCLRRAPSLIIFLRVRLSAVSEKRPVGSLRRDKDALLDLMGDESAAGAGGAGAGAGAAAAAAVPAQSAQDLLADIFGSSDATSAPSSSGASAAAKPSDPVNDIMSLFGSTSLSPQATGASNASNDLFTAMRSTSPGGSTPTAPPAPRSPAPAAPAPSAAPAASAGPRALEAYDRNGLRITLTPVRDTNNRMVVNILAKFTATQPVSGVNFQAAVPKVRVTLLPLVLRSLPKLTVPPPRRHKSCRCSPCPSRTSSPARPRRSSSGSWSPPPARSCASGYGSPSRPRRESRCRIRPTLRSRRNSWLVREQRWPPFRPPAFLPSAEPRLVPVRPSS